MSILVDKFPQIFRIHLRLSLDLAHSDWRFANKCIGVIHKERIGPFLPISFDSNGQHELFTVTPNNH